MSAAANWRAWVSQCIAPTPRPRGPSVLAGREPITRCSIAASIAQPPGHVKWRTMGPELAEGWTIACILIPDLQLQSHPSSAPAKIVKKLTIFGGPVIMRVLEAGRRPGAQNGRPWRI